MTDKDDSGLSEEQMDEIVNRVVGQLSEAGVGDDAGEADDGTEIEVRSADETDLDVEDEADYGYDRDDDEPLEESGGEWEPDEVDEVDADEGEMDPDDIADEEASERSRSRKSEARKRREEARERRREARRRAREAREAGEGLEDLGDRIETAVEARLEHLGEHLEHAIGPGVTEPPDVATPGVVIGPDDTREKAVYKTQLQKGGRVAVPDTEIEALGLEPGDALQVVLYPVE